MKFLITLFVVFSTLTLNAASMEVCKNDFTSVDQSTISLNIDKKKSRKHKKSNKRRKKACANWSKRSYAG